MIKRSISSKILAYARKYPVVTITGPRQSGKTTLCKSLFPDKKYVSLESIDSRERARRDPRGFLEEFSAKGAVLDEIQRVPELTSYLQEFVDNDGSAGKFILTGSQNFQVMETVSQSLAGRTALATLLPFAYGEVYKKKHPAIEVVLYTGFYPRIHDKKLNPTEALAFYVSTYLERDIRALINIKDLSRFEVFLKLCAGRTGQILNVSALANECGVNHNTAKSWISVLEASYVIYLLRPYHMNFNKRLVKAPKLYFTDTGLAAYLLDISGPGHLTSHPLRGALFETFVAMEILKYRLNKGLLPNIYYFRDNVGNEVDVVIDTGGKTIPLEIKSGKTAGNDFFKNVAYYRKLNPSKNCPGAVVYGGDERHSYGENKLIGYRGLVSFLEKNGF